VETLFTLITGRTIKQGSATNFGKKSEAYEREISTIELNEKVMERMGISEGEEVIVESAYGSERFFCRKGNMPLDVAFVPYGHKVNKVVGTDTHGTGMPDFRDFLLFSGLGG
jgi:formylmethanofuran dehydrogenase subunit D